ncbi:podoplanin isoform X1 [Sarcophilus harrisii]|uniref:Podoplanin n=1 Tax=Sarcophilus harrisii TaxID=9305 RepID=G3WRM2_SARHA|nr:podoplanin isoform X1 [Sarcophilus harrisii]
MWQFQILLLVLGGSPFWVIAQEDSTVLPEDAATTIDSIDGKSYPSEDAPTLPPTRTPTTFHTPGIEDKPTPEPTVHTRENSTSSRVETDHPSEKVGGETKTTEKGGLETVTLVGIILGIVIAIGIIAGIIIAVVRKMSGRYSP